VSDLESRRAWQENRVDLATQYASTDLDRLHTMIVSVPHLEAMFDVRLDHCTARKGRHLSQGSR
jgi:hypothetical protein